MIHASQAINGSRDESYTSLGAGCIYGTQVSRGAYVIFRSRVVTISAFRASQGDNNSHTLTSHLIVCLLLKLFF